MSKRGKLEFEWVMVERVFLDTENPRFPENTADTETDAIELLCKDEQVLELAKDIVAQDSINPLQLLGVIPDHKPSEYSGDHTYIVVEGNRRLCALKLLIDPYRAPSRFRKSFEALSKNWEPIDEVPVTIFQNRDEPRPWIKRTHGGLQGGIGRKDWNAEQNQRFSGNNKNKRALAVLDYAQKKGMISERDRKGKLTTTERYLSSELFRDVIGIDDANIDDISKNRPDEDFDKRLGQFIHDLVEGEKINSRVGNTKVKRNEYARQLASSVQISDNRTESISLTSSLQTNAKKDRRRGRPRIAPKVREIRYNSEIRDLLKQIHNSKLESLYYSICKVDLDDAYVPLLTIGSWAFVESLSAAAGRKTSTSFASFYSNSQLRELGLGSSSKETRPISDALTRLEGNGNTTKHHFISAHFHGQQLANDMQCLEPLIVATCKKIIEQKN